LISILNLALLLILAFGFLHALVRAKYRYKYSFLFFILEFHISLLYYLEIKLHGFAFDKEIYFLTIIIFLFLVFLEITYYGYREKEVQNSNGYQGYGTKIYPRNENNQKDLISNLSFELQAPLGSILGIADYIRKDLGSDISDSTSENLDILIRTAGKAHLILENLVEYSYLLKNEILLNREKISLSNLIHQVKNDFSDKTILIKTDIIINLQNEVDVYVDIIRMKRAINNILIYLGKKQEKQSFMIESSGVISREDLIQINILDLSSDLDSDLKSNIYNSLSNLKDANIKIDSKVIGVSLSKKLIELHGGEIWNDPQIKYKNSVSLTLPILTGQMILENKLKYEVQFISENSTSIPFTILAIDDELINIEILKNSFNHLNYHLLSLTNGYEAIELIENEIIPDIILIDIDMPEVDGYTLTKMIRKRYTKEEIPVLLFSSSSWVEDRSRAFESGANDIVTKPFHTEELLSRINTLVSLRRSIIENQKHKLLEHELSIARKFQMKLLPNKKLNNRNVNIETMYLPMTYLAGDFYDFFEDSNGIGILMADVTGHGIPAAMVTSMLKAVFHTLRKELANPSRMMKGINEILIGNDNQLLTSVYLYIDIKNKKLFSANAGHPPLLLQRKDSSIQEIKSKGKLIGFSLKEVWETVEIPLDAGDRIILYTDGVTEVKNFNGEQLGDIEFLNYMKSYQSLNGKDMIEAARRMILDYCFQVNQEDDLTLMVIDILE
jgi:two-component system, sensor histidine kinase ChiS